MISPPRSLPLAALLLVLSCVVLPCPFPARAETTILLPVGTAHGGNSPQTSVFLYTYDTDPAAGTISTTTAGTARFHATAVQLANSDVLVAGGEKLGGGFFDTAEIWDASQNQFRNVGSLGTGRYLYGISRLSDGRVLITGGVNDTVGRLNTAEIYDPSTETWSATGNLGSKRMKHAQVTLADGKVLIAGGDLASGQGTNTAEVWDPATGNFSATSGTLPFTVSGGLRGVLLKNGKVLLAGGRVDDDNAGTSSFAAVYDPGTNSFTAVSGGMASARDEAAMVGLLDGTVLIAGGLTTRTNTSNVATADLFDPETETFSATTGNMPAALFDHAIVDLPDGDVLIMGGATGGSASTAIYVYDRETKTFTTSSATLSSSRIWTPMPGLGFVVSGGAFTQTTAASVPATRTWVQRDGDNVLRGSRSQGMFFDRTRGTVVTFGGFLHDTATRTDQTWEWDGTSWTQLSPTSAPSARDGHRIAYDTARNRAVLFGGWNGSSNFSETWEWDGTTWAQASPTSSPPARRAHSMAYDHVRQRVVLFGGQGDSARLNDTWEYDGNSWVQTTADGVAGSPSQRVEHTIVYDSNSGKVLLFGGVENPTGNNDIQLGDTWEYDGGSWTQMSPASSPTPRYVFGMDHDPVRGVTVLFGGYAGSPAPAANRFDTWEWNGTTWTQRSPSSTPVGQAGQGMIFDSYRQRMVMLGDAVLNGAPAATWEYDGTTWTEKTPITASPTGGLSAGMAYDAARSKVVLFGGNRGGINNETWEYDGFQWTQQSPASSPRKRHWIQDVLVHETARSQTLLFGGEDDPVRLNDTVIWKNGTWTTQSPSNSPGTRSYHSMAYDASRGVSVLFAGFSGSVLGDTWEWDGTDWSQKSPATSPAARYQAGMDFDSARSRTVLFGGKDTGQIHSDTWEWDGTGWDQRSPSSTPSGRWAHAFAYDSERGRAILFGGYDGGVSSTLDSNDILNDTWEWDGSNWTQLQLSSSPGKRLYHSAAYDPTRKTLVVFGGNNNSSSLDDTWELPSNSPPSVAATVSPTFPETGMTVTLTASASDPDSDTPTYRWLQTFGPRVTINSSTSAKATFIASEAGIYGFQVVADDGNGAAAYALGTLGVAQASQQPFSVTSSTPATRTWVQRDGSSPSGRAGPALVFDSRRARVVMFGGGVSSTQNDTWEWDGTSWTQISTSTAPSVRFSHTMAYDPSRGLTVLFGGTPNGSTRLGDTWEYDGISWAQKSPATSPPGRSGQGMAFDGIRGTVILFGGFDGSRRSDTWEWDGTNWAELSPTNSPPARDTFSMDYDSSRGRIVLFGGNGSSGKLGDTWEWDGSNWSQASPTASPGARSVASGRYDPSRNRFVIFGGNDGSRLSETWEYDGTTWTQRSPTSNPTARNSLSAALDTVRGRYVLFGGDDAGASENDETWEFDGTNWTEKTPGTTAPPVRSDHALSYDSARTQTVLFGGRDGATERQDTWTWNGLQWTQSSPATAPAARFNHAMAYDSARERAVLLGGFDGSSKLSDTWEWDGTNWAAKSPSSSPSARSDLALTFDSSRSRVFLFGGFGPFSDSWEWDGTNWAQKSPGSSPSARYSHPLSFDPQRGRVVLFGGFDDSSNLSDTWEWDGTSWSQSSPASSPPARRDFAMAQSTPGGHIVLFGGMGNSGSLGDTWEWNGTSWTQVSSSASPTARVGHAMSYDSTRRSVLLFGGTDSGGTTNDTWELPSNTPPTLSATYSPSAPESGNIVSLSASFSDTDNDTATYRWFQTFGTPVTINGSSDASASFTPSTSGSYGFQIVAEDGNGGYAYALATVTATGVTVTANAGNDQTVNTGASVNLSATGSGEGSLTYAWTQTSGTTVSLTNANTANASFTAPGSSGSLTFQVTVTDSASNTANDSVTVTVNAPPTANAGSDQTVNINTVANLSGSGTDSDGGTVTYSWSRAGGSGPTVTINNASSATANFTPTAAGTYVFTLTTSDGQGGTAQDSVTITGNTPPTANAGSDQTANLGVQVQISASGSDADGDSLTYSWSPTSGLGGSLSNAAIRNPLFTPASAGNVDFTVTVSDGKGGTAQDTVRVTGNTVPTVDAGNDSTVNVDTLVTLAATASDGDGQSIGYTWTQTGGPSVTLNGANTASATFTPSVAGTYGFRVTASDGVGGSAQDDVVITVNTPPTAGAGADRTVNVQSQVTLAGSGSDSDGDPVVYSWSRAGGSGPTLELTGSDTASPNFTPTVAGTYTFTLTVSDGRGGSTQASVTITVNTPPTVNAGADQSVNVDTQVNLAATATDGDGDSLTYSWSRAGGSGPTLVLQGSSTATPSFTPTAGGTYTFMVTASDGRGGEAQDSVTITVNGRPVANAGPDRATPPQQEVLLDGSNSNDPDGDAITYAWLQLTGGAAILQDATSAVARFNPQAEGTFTLKLTVSDSVLSAEDTVTVTAARINFEPQADAGPDRTVTAGEVALLDGSNSSDPNPDDTITFQWTRTGGVSGTLTDATSAVARFAPASPGTATFSLTVTDPEGLTGADTMTVTRNNAVPTVDAGADQTVLPGATVTLPGLGQDADGDSLTFSWTRTGGSGPAIVIDNASQATANFAPPSGGTYELTLTVTDTRSGSASDIVTITANAPPAASAGADLTTNRNEIVSLSATATDPDGDALFYRWSQLAGLSSATLTDDLSATARFTAPFADDYVLQVAVTDSRLTTVDSVTVSVLNRPPEAVPGSDLTVSPGDTVALDGSGSSDPDGDALSYSWSVTRGPAFVSLSSPASPRTTLQPEVTGLYTILLTVDDGQGAQDSAEVSVVVSDTTSPTAQLSYVPSSLVTSPGQVVVRVDFSEAIRLTDPAPGITFVRDSGTRSLPGGDLEPVSDRVFTFTRPVTAANNGTYRVRLTAADLSGNTVLQPQAGNVVQIDIPNTAPTADAGSDRTVSTSTPITLNGSGSFDPDGDDLTYAWTLISQPVGSDVSLLGAATARPSFTPVRDGVHVFQLVVSDPLGETDQDAVVITSVQGTQNRNPTADAGPNRQPIVRSIVRLDGRNSSDPDGDNLNYAWSLASRPQGSSVTTASFTGVTDPQMSFAPDIEGPYIVQLTVADGNGGSDSVNVRLDVKPIPIDIHANNRDGASIPVTIGRTLPGEIGEPTDVDFLEFAVRPDTIYTLTLTSPDISVSKVTLIAPGGEQLASDEGSPSSPAVIRDFRAVSDQVHFVRITSNDGTTGRWRLFIDARPEEDKLPPPLELLVLEQSGEARAQVRTRGTTNPLFVLQLVASYEGDSLDFITVDRGPVAAQSFQEEVQQFTFPFVGISLETKEARAAAVSEGLLDTLIFRPRGADALELDRGIVSILRASVTRQGIQVPIVRPTADAGVSVNLTSRPLPDGRRGFPDPLSSNASELKPWMRLDGRASSDPNTEGETLPLRFNWSVLRSPSPTTTLSDPTSPVPTFDDAGPGLYEFGLQVSNGVLTSPTDTVTYLVDLATSLPTADILISTTSTRIGRNRGRGQEALLVAAPAEVTLDGRGSVDPARAGPLTFDWSQRTGPPLGSIPSTPVVTLVLDQPGLYRFELVVTAQGGRESRPAVAGVQVYPAGGRLDLSLEATSPDVVGTGRDLGADDDLSNAPSLRLRIGKRVNLRALVGARAGDRRESLAYFWRQKSGPAVEFDQTSEADNSVDFTPVREGVYEFVCTARVVDEQGNATRLKSERTIRVVVDSDRRRVPTATVGVALANPGKGGPREPLMKGPDRFFVRAGDVVLLDGSGSAADGGMAYRWSQRASPPVSMSNPFGSTTTFVAPQLSEEGASRSYHFQLFVDEVTTGGGPEDARGKETLRSEPQVTEMVVVPQGADIFELTLTPGLNLIGFPLSPVADGGPATLDALVREAGAGVGMAVEGGRWRPAGLASRSEGEGTPIRGSRGYLIPIGAKEPVTLRIIGVGWPEADRQIPISKGLNLVSFPGTTVPFTIAGANSLLGLVPNATFIARVVPGTGGASRFDVYIPGVSSLREAFPIEAGRAYLIYSTASGNLDLRMN